MTNQILSNTMITVRRKTILADTLTPVGCYLRLRDRHQQAVLLESNDFRSTENCFSFIGLDPIARFRLTKGQLDIQLPNGEMTREVLADPLAASVKLESFLHLLDPGQESGATFNGLFGHTAFEAYQYFDTLEYPSTDTPSEVPDLHYCLYRFVLAFDHFREELHLLENQPKHSESRLEELERELRQPVPTNFPFQTRGEEYSSLTDEDFIQMVRAGKQHCRRGDVFQIVLSRRFSQKFRGDDFQLYRQLRSLNPSPYLFYFDYGDYHIFGSSPEAQLVVKGQEASVNPIAGTYARTGNDEADRQQAQTLATDPKENAEHIMLVDLARNDLGRSAEKVEVRKLRDVQYFSHVIHLVSTVSAQIPEAVHPLRIFADTFPAGTLSGAPKFRAMELIRQYEAAPRGFYGGAIGWIGFDGQMNQAIVIRSFFSKDQVLHYQAGAGVVDASDEQKELQEVYNKLGALHKAIERAENAIG